MKNQEPHGQPGHLNIFRRDHDSPITGHGKHARVIAWQPQGATFTARIDLCHADLMTEPTAAQVLTVARKDQGHRGQWIPDPENPPIKYFSNGCDRIQWHFCRP
jgi:hypothetical protein